MQTEVVLFLRKEDRITWEIVDLLYFDSDNTSLPPSFSVATKSLYVDFDFSEIDIPAAMPAFVDFIKRTCAVFIEEMDRVIHELEQKEATS